jgi:hypothetical protein
VPYIYIYATGRYSAVEIRSHCANMLTVIDLNYRISLPDADVRHLLRSVPPSGGIHTLLQFDEVQSLAIAVHVPPIKLLSCRAQLKSSIRHSRAFAEFEERPITFLPSGASVGRGGPC